MTNLSKMAQDAFNTILVVRRHPTAHTPLAEKKILERLNVPDYIACVLALEEHAKSSVRQVSAVTNDR
jgi:hypothetical protein